MNWKRKGNFKGKGNSITPSGTVVVVQEGRSGSSIILVSYMCITTELSINYFKNPPINLLT